MTHLDLVLDVFVVKLLSSRSRKLGWGSHLLGFVVVFCKRFRSLLVRSAAARADL